MNHKPPQGDKYKLYNEWFLAEGGLMPKVEFPAFFDGVLGCRAIKEIGHREAYIFVPYKMVMNIHHYDDHEILGPIIAKHDNIFRKGTSDGDHLTMVLVLIYEMSLGPKSYWYPYLRILPDIELTGRWDKATLEMSQCKEFVDTL